MSHTIYESITVFASIGRSYDMCVFVYLAHMRGQPRMYKRLRDAILFRPNRLQNVRIVITCLVRRSFPFLSADSRAV